MKYSKFGMTLHQYIESEVLMIVMPKKGIIRYRYCGVNTLMLTLGIFKEFCYTQ